MLTGQQLYEEWAKRQTPHPALAWHLIGTAKQYVWNALADLARKQAVKIAANATIAIERAYNDGFQAGEQFAREDDSTITEVPYA